MRATRAVKRTAAAATTAAASAASPAPFSAYGVEQQQDDPLAQAIAKNASAMMLIKMIDNFFIFQVFLSFQSMKIVVYLF